MGRYVELENYECDGCCADRFGIMGCGSCPRNDSRIREWRNKYGDNSFGYSTNVGGILYED